MKTRVRHPKILANCIFKLPSKFIGEVAEIPPKYCISLLKNNLTRWFSLFKPKKARQIIVIGVFAKVLLLNVLIQKAMAKKWT